jgi:hypothetical protein
MILVGRYASPFERFPKLEALRARANALPAFAETKTRALL